MQMIPNLSEKVKQIQCGISHAFNEKVFKPGYDETAFGSSFKLTPITASALAAHILAGEAWIPGQFKGNRRTNDTFISTQAIALDYDDNVSVLDALNVPFIAQYAALIHPSATSSTAKYKTRVIFILDEPIEGVERARAFIRAIAEHIGLPYDPASYKPAQLFYGSRNTVEQPHINTEAVLCVQWAAGLTADAARRDDEIRDLPKVQRKPIAPDSNRAAKYAAAAFDKALTEIANAGEGGRNNTLFKGACDLFGMALGGWPGITVSSVENSLTAIYNQWPNPHKSKGTVNSARKHAKAKDLVLPDKPARSLAERVQRVSLPDLGASLSVQAEFITEAVTTEQIRQQSTVAMRSGTGTGKTELVDRYLKSLPDDTTYIAIAQFVLLTEGLSNRLQAVHYRDFSGEDSALWTKAGQVVSSVNSLYKAAGRSFDVVFIDEFEQVLQFLNGGTFRGGEAAQAYEVFKNMIRNARQVIVADANLSLKSIGWLKAIRGGEPFVIENTYQRQRGEITFLSDKYHAIAEIERLIDENRGPLLIPCSSERDASEIHRYLTGRYGTEQGVKITRDTSQTKAAQTFIKDINTRLGSVRWLVYTSSMGSGVDVQAPVHAVVGIFNSDPLAPENVVQMMGRARHAKQRFACVPNGEGGRRETDAKALFARRKKSAQDTAISANFAAYGVSAWDDTTYALLRLEAEFTAQQNREKNNFAAYTAERLRADGFTIGCDETENKVMRETFLELRKAISAENDALTMSENPITPEQLDAMRNRGVEITPAIRAGVLRYAIEDCLGQKITEAMLSDFKSKLARRAFVAGADLYEASEALAESDRKEAAERVPLHRRAYRTERYSLFIRVMQQAGFNTLSALFDFLTEAHTKDAISERFGFITDETLLSDFQRLLRYQRNRNAATVTGVLRYFLNAYGLHLESEQRRIEGEKVRFYYLTADALAVWTARIKTRLTAEQAKRESALKPQCKVLNEVLSQPHPTINTQPVDVQPLSEPPFRPRPAFAAAFGQIGAGI